MRTVRKDDVRPASAAGLFYPQNPDELARLLNTLLLKSRAEKPSGAIKALVAPHAGYSYSGEVAAAGYACLAGSSFDVVAVIGPSHHESFPGASVFTGKAYETPLGLVPVANELGTTLAENSPVLQATWLGHGNEHAVEVQLPFLQSTIGDFELIPVVIGHQNLRTAVALGMALADILADSEALVVASSDLSHYHYYDDACALDQKAAALIEGLDENRFAGNLQSGACQACGWGAIVAAMVAGKRLGAKKADVCAYRNSGDVTGDYGQVVGYLSALLYDSLN